LWVRNPARTLKKEKPTSTIKICIHEQSISCCVAHATNDNNSIDPIFVVSHLWHNTKPGLPDVFFKPKIPNLCKFWRVLDGKMLIYFMAIGKIFKDIWDILWPFGTFCVHLVHFFLSWYHVPRKIWQPCTKPRTDLTFRHYFIYFISISALPVNGLDTAGSSSSDHNSKYGRFQWQFLTPTTVTKTREPILRLFNLQLQRQRFCRLERFYIREKPFLF
jgi:hypothetical protein